MRSRSGGVRPRLPVAAFRGKTRHHVDIVVRPLTSRAAGSGHVERPTQEEAEAAVRVLIRWAGDDPDREGLRETPQRVVKAYRELYAGYGQDPRAVLDRVFEEVEGYGDMVLVRGIPF